MNYKFKPNDKVMIFNFVGREVPVEIFTAYRSDTENHESDPHNRYVVIEYTTDDFIVEVYDVSEDQLGDLL